MYEYQVVFRFARVPVKGNVYVQTCGICALTDLFPWQVSEHHLSTPHHGHGICQRMADPSGHTWGPVAERVCWDNGVSLQGPTSPSHWQRMWERQWRSQSEICQFEGRREGGVCHSLPDQLGGYKWSINSIKHPCSFLQSPTRVL